MNISLAMDNNLSAIPIQLISQTNWNQYTISLVLASLFTIFFLYTILKSYVHNPATLLLLLKFKRLTHKPTLLIRHNSAGLFFSSMITRDDTPKILKFLEKIKHQPFNLILDTPGGDVFATMQISKIFKNYPAQIDAYIPNYAMSGGTVLALSCSKMHFNKHACLGMVDPQIGSFFSYGSASGWDEVLKLKKNKAEDTSIIYRKLGKQVEETIFKWLYGLVAGKCKQPEKFSRFLANGQREHIYQVDSKMLEKYGFKTTEITRPENIILTKLLNQKTTETIFGVK